MFMLQFTSFFHLLDSDMYEEIFFSSSALFFLALFYTLGIQLMLIKLNKFEFPCAGSRGSNVTRWDDCSSDVFAYLYCLRPGHGWEWWVCEEHERRKWWKEMTIIGWTRRVLEKYSKKISKHLFLFLSSHFAQCMLKWSHLTRHKFFGHFSARLSFDANSSTDAMRKKEKRRNLSRAMTSTRQQQRIERRMRLNFSLFLFVKNFRFLIFLSYQTTNWMAQARAQYSQESHAAVWGRTGSFFVCLRWWVRVFDFFYLSNSSRLVGLLERSTSFSVA